MMNFYKILFFNSMMMGTFMSISSLSWLMIWIGLEINLLSIIPLMKNKKNFYSTEASIKYFITQTTASILFLFSMCLLSNLKTLNLTNYSYLLIIINSSLFTKLGAAPFHFWYPEVLNGLNWNSIFILSTWQKIAPFILISYFMNSTIFISIIIILSSMISGFQSLNQTLLKKIIAYSSINHVGWMTACMMNSLSIWLLYFFIYSLINLNIIFMLNLFNISHFYQLNKILNNKKMKLFFMINFLSLSGLPPFLGFLPKWLTIYFMIKNNFYLITILMIIFSLMLMYMYLRITFSSLSLNYEESILSFLNFPLSKSMMLNFILNLGLMICFITFNFI